MQALDNFTPTTDLIGGSPKMMYTFFLLHQCSKYLDAIDSTKNPEVITNALLAFCPDTEQRRKLHSIYIKERDKPDGNPTNASILVIGDFISYLSEALEFTQKSYGAF